MLRTETNTTPTSEERSEDEIPAEAIADETELLETLARDDFNAPSDLSLSRCRNSEDLEDVRRQTAEIASRMVALPGGEKHRVALFRYLQKSADRLIDAGSFEQVRDVATAALAYSMLAVDSDPTYRAARSYLDHFKDDDRIRRILGSACTLDPFPVAAIDLLESLGDRVIGPSMAALIEVDSPTAIDALQRLLAARGPELLRPELVARLEKGWSSWQKIFAVLRRMPAEHAHSLVELLLDHDEFEVRREALMLLHDLDGDRELRLSEVLRALTDDSARFARVAVRCLAEMDGDEPLDMLGAYVDGSLGVTPVFDAGVRAAQSLLRLKSPGVRRLCRASERMRKSLDPRRTALSRKVVELLATEDDLRARACVNGWRFSPAWWIAFFVRSPQGSELRSSP